MSESQTEATKKVENFTSEALRELLGELTTDQLRFVVARQDYATDKEAAEAIGVTPRTVYGWPEVVKGAVQQMALDGIVTAQHIITRNVAKAALVKVAGLDSEDERVRQAASTEIIDRALGKAMQAIRHEGKDGGPIVTANVELTDVERKAAIQAILDGEGLV